MWDWCLTVFTEIMLAVSSVCLINNLHPYMLNFRLFTILNKNDQIDQEINKYYKKDVHAKTFRTVQLFTILHL